MQYSFFFLIFVLSVCTSSVFSQDRSADELHYEVSKVYPSISFTKEEMNRAETIVDLNPYYKPSWIREYVSIEILAFHNGDEKKALSADENLTQEQKELIKRADTGTGISVLVQYIPENNLPVKEVHEIPFSFTIEPEYDAKYPGGSTALGAYLEKKAIDKIPVEHFEGYRLAAVKFTVDEAGRIIDAHVFWPSENDDIDALLLETVCNMTDWIPAEYEDGTKIKQEFVLAVGNMESCVVPLLNIRNGFLARNE